MGLIPDDLATPLIIEPTEVQEMSREQLEQEVTRHRVGLDPQIQRNAKRVI